MRTFILTSLLTLLPTTFSIPTRPPISNTSALPVHFDIVVFPTFQALDVFGPLDVLNSFSLLYNSTMHLSVISKTLDPVTTNETVGLSDIDVLIVPGGGGTRELLEEEIAFVETMYTRVKYFISVCTGATILTRAGILDGRKATTNKRFWTWATSTGPKVEWIHTARWVVDGNIWSSSGISAGIDVAYAWLGHIYGEEVADYMAMSLEYERWTNSTDDPFAAIWSQDGFHIQQSQALLALNVPSRLMMILE